MAKNNPFDRRLTHIPSEVLSKIARIDEIKGRCVLAEPLALVESEDGDRPRRLVYDLPADNRVGLVGHRVFKVKYLGHILCLTKVLSHIVFSFPIQI